MINIVIQTCDAGMAVNVGGSVETTIKTFSFSHPELEEYWLKYQKAKDEALARKGAMYWHRTVVGIEVVP